MRVLIFVPLLFAAVACRGPTYRAARVAGRPEAPVTVHRKLDKRIHVLDFSTNVTHDGRMAIKVRLSNATPRETAVVAHTDWFNDAGRVVEQGAHRVVMLPAGAIVAYEDASFSSKARWFTVALRPVSETAE